jgi:hypothetical protein
VLALPQRDGLPSCWRGSQLGSTRAAVQREVWGPTIVLLPPTDTSTKANMPIPAEPKLSPRIGLALRVGEGSIVLLPQDTSTTANMPTPAEPKQSPRVGLVLNVLRLPRDASTTANMPTPAEPKQSPRVGLVLNAAWFVPPRH